MFERLIQQLFATERSVAETARLALIDSGPMAVEPLLAALKHPQPQRRLRILEVLGILADLRTTPSVVSLLQNDPNPEVRVAAASTLIAIDDVEAIDPLLMALQDSDLQVRLAVVRVLGAYGIETAVPHLLKQLAYPPVAYEAALVLGEHFHTQAIEPFWLEVLGQGDLTYQLDAIRVLGELRSPAAVDLLLVALNAPDSAIRAAAAHALGRVGAAAAVDPLLYCLARESVGAVRAAAAEALGYLNDRYAVEPLKDALHDRYAPLQQAAITALGLLGGEDIVVALLSILQQDALPQTRSAIARALGHLGDPAGTRALELLFLNDGDYNVQYSAALGLADLANPRAIEILRSALLQEKPLILQAAARALGLVRDSGTTARMNDLLQNPERGVRHAAAIALLQINDDYTQEALSTLISDLFHADYEVCWFTLRSLQEYPNHRFLKPLEAVLADSDGNTRALAVEVLGAIGSSEAIAYLVPHLHDADWAVRRATRLALIKLGYFVSNL